MTNNDKELELNKEYTYQQICEVLGWEVKTGNAKLAQIKKIETEYEFYHPANNKTHKPKKSYIFTAKTDKQYVSNHGGARVGAGKTTVLKDEIETLIHAWLHRELSKNQYFNQYTSENKDVVCFSNNSLGKDFGIFYDIYDNSVLEDNQIFGDRIASDIREAIRERVRSLITNRLVKMNGLSINDTVLFRLSGDNKDVWRQSDKLLDEYKGYEQEFLDYYRYTNIGDVYRNVKTKDLNECLLYNFNNKHKKEGIEFVGVRRSKKIVINKDYYDTYGNIKLANNKEIQELRNTVNKYVIESMEKTCFKKANKYFNEVQGVKDGSNLLVWGNVNDTTDKKIKKKYEKQLEYINNPFYVDVETLYNDYITVIKLWVKLKTE